MVARDQIRRLSDHCPTRWPTGPAMVPHRHRHGLFPRLCQAFPHGRRSGDVQRPSDGFWSSLAEAWRTGELQNEGKRGGDFFAALYAEPERLRGFLRAMTGLSTGAAQAIAARFPWKNYATFADIGTAQGIVPVTLAHAHSHLA